jgi:hypothetical protein
MVMWRSIEKRAYAVQLMIAKLMALVLLAMGATSPIFRHDQAGAIVGVSCTAVLAVLAGLAMFRATWVLDRIRWAVGMSSAIATAMIFWGFFAAIVAQRLGFQPETRFGVGWLAAALVALILIVKRKTLARSMGFEDETETTPNRRSEDRE